jgi:hypothetical protein
MQQECEFNLYNIWRSDTANPFIFQTLGRENEIIYFMMLMELIMKYIISKTVKEVLLQLFFCAP